MRAPSDKNQVQVIARAAHILRALEGEDAGLSLGQIAARVGLARSTVQRIVASLEAEKLLIAASPTGRVRLGPAILRLASSVTGDFVARARPHLIRLSDELRETVDLAAVRRDHLMFIDQVIGSHRLRTVSARRRDVPAATARPTARPISAGSTKPRSKQLIGKSYEARTPNTLTRLNTLLADLRAVRKNGIAYDREEHTVGICAVGVALHDPLGNPVAISVPVPSQRFREQQKLIAERLLATKRAMQADWSAAAA